MRSKQRRLRSDPPRWLMLRRAEIATGDGVADEVPAIPGIERFYGRSVHPCPYCDGWEGREQPLAIYGREEKGSGLSLMLTLWSKDLVLCTDSPAELSNAERERLAVHEIPVREEPIARLEWTEEGLLERGGLYQRRGAGETSDVFQHRRAAEIFFDREARLELDEKGRADTGDFEESNVPGLYIVGDASGDIQFAIVAAAEGARAAFAINKALLRQAALI
jgi:thioredoxin reductase